MTPSEITALDDQAYNLMFDVRRSVRYHDKRAAFFERMHRLNSAFTILLSSSVVFDIARPGDTPRWMIALALVAALVSVLDLVLGLSKMAALHRDLQLRFAGLERSMVLGPAQGECWTQYQAERLLIEMEEPTPYVMLDTICHNELLNADGFAKHDDRRVKVHWFHRLTCQWWPWTDAFAHG
jgi:hypothetical protein